MAPGKKRRMQLLGGRNMGRVAVRELNDYVVFSRIRHRSCERSDFGKLQVHRPSDVFGRSSIIRRVAIFLGTVSPIFALMVQAASSVTLVWNPSPDRNVAGYRLYHGGASHNYTNTIAVGLGASATISGLAEGATYFFAVTALDNLGMESSYSNEISYTVPGTRPRLQLLLSPSNQVVLRITGQPGHAYEVQATQNFTNWNVIGLVTLELGVSLDFIDPNATGRPSRFYRLRDIPRPTLQLLLSPSKQVVLRITGQSGHTYEIQATQNFTNWNVVGIVTLGLGVSVDLIDANAASRPSRFFRLREILN